MKFTMDKKSNTIGVIVMFTICIASIIIFYFLPGEPHWKPYWYFIALSVPVIMLGQIIADYKTWIAFDENGVSAFRNGVNYKFKWSEIHRVEYKPAKLFPPLRMVIIHGFGNQDVHIEFTFGKHKLICRTLMEYIEKYAPSDICVDQKLYEYVAK